MRDIAPIQQLVKDLQVQALIARALNLKLAWLQNGTGKERNELIIDLTTFLHHVSGELKSPLHALQMLIKDLTDPAYADTLGLDSNADLAHCRGELAKLTHHFETVRQIHASGTQPKDWLEFELKRVSQSLSELVSGFADLQAKCAITNSSSVGEQ